VTKRQKEAKIKFTRLFYVIRLKGKSKMNQLLNSEPRIVIKPSVARKLLKNGFRIIDIKPQRQEDGTLDFTRCVFLFEYTDNIDSKIKELT
jgi:hypothetical protein